MKAKVTNVTYTDWWRNIWHIYYSHAHYPWGWGRVISQRPTGSMPDESKGGTHHTIEHPMYISRTSDDKWINTIEMADTLTPGVEQRGDWVRHIIAIYHCLRLLPNDTISTYETRSTNKRWLGNLISIGDLINRHKRSVFFKSTSNRFWKGILITSIHFEI